MMSFRGRIAASWLALLAVGLAAAGLRYAFIESSAVAQLCSAGHEPAWCSVRQWLVLGFLYGVYGIVALIAAVVALWSRRAMLAWLAAALGAFALILYCFEAGALALLLGCLRLLRLQAASCMAPREPHRQRNGQVQSQP
jgi:hypothetical protein